MDALTRLRNHGTFREDLREAVAQAQPFALLMLDLDDFKVYNDRHGHEAGNRLLKAIAGTLDGACRESDRVYRYGGDEFSLILPGAGQGDALEVAERINGALALVRGNDPRRAEVRCSVGVATYPADGGTRDELLLAADRALYAAKRAGRRHAGPTGSDVDDVVPFGSNSLAPVDPVGEALLAAVGRIERVVGIVIARVGERGDGLNRQWHALVGRLVTGDQGQVNAVESRRQTAMTAPVATSVGYTKPAAVTGSKMFYDRILPSRPGASAQVDQEAAKRASLTGLEKHLAVPFDLQSAQIKRVSANTD